jgi:pimeloyl-ACP methyl ester carboxylesterase
VDGLALIVPHITSDPTKRKVPSHITLLRDPSLVAELPPHEAEIVEGAIVVQSRKVLDRLKNEMFPAFELADTELIARLQKYDLFSFDVDVLPQPFVVPTLILTGRQDSMAGYRSAWDILENYPRATFVVLDRAGHALGVEQEELFRTLVSEWLDRVEEYVMA